MHTLTSSDTMSIQLAGAKATADCAWFVSYYDAVLATQATSADANAHGTTNGVTAVQLLAAPSAGYVRHPRSFSMPNSDTAAVTASVLIGSVVVYKATLAVGDVLQMSERRGWFVTDSSGATKGTTVATFANIAGSPTDNAALASSLAALAPLHTPFGTPTATSSGVLTLPASCWTIKATGTEDFLGMSPGSLTPGDIFILRIASDRNVQHMATVSAPAVPFNFRTLGFLEPPCAGARLTLQLGEGGTQWDVLAIV